MKFQFKCIGCGKLFEEDITGEAIEIFLDAFEAGRQEIMQGCCSECQETKNNLATNELIEGLSSGSGKIFMVAPECKHD